MFSNTTLLIIGDLMVGLFFCYQFVNAIVDLWYFTKNRNICAGNPAAQVGYFYNHAGAWRSRFFILLFVLLLAAWWVVWVNLI